MTSVTNDPLYSKSLALAYNMHPALREILPPEKAEEMTMPQALRYVGQTDRPAWVAWRKAISQTRSA